jgi:outer membrane protein assembly factor BamB
VICTPGGATATLAALDRHTGKIVWRSRVRGGDAAAYTSAVAGDLWGRRHYVQFLSGGVVAVRADTGALSWRYDRPANGTANCTTPILADGQVFAASGYGVGGGLLRCTGSWADGDLQEVYFTHRMVNHHGGVVLVDGYLYGCNDPGSLVCLDFRTGRVMWQERRPGKGSISAADGRLYYRNESGPVRLIEANPRRYVECGNFKPPRQSDSPAWPHPVIANGRLYLRDQDVMWCYDVKG